MKTTVHAQNPFGYNRYGFLWEVLRAETPGKHLDYGAHDGKVLKKLLSTAVIQEGVGVDVNAEAIHSAGAADVPYLTLNIINKGCPLPFTDETFDSISILDVLEHVHDQISLLAELRRVLKTGGTLVITVPRKHIFSFLDVGNYKFVFPRAHRFVYQRKYSSEEYRKRYIECQNGLFGDIEREKMWHQHFTERELHELLAECGFGEMQFDGTALFTRPLFATSLVMPFLKKPIHRLMAVDSRRFSQMNLFCKATKRAAQAKEETRSQLETGTPLTSYQPT